MNRREFLAGSAALAIAPARPAGAAEPPYGPLRPPDANGIRLPAGFTSRVLARSGTPVGTTGYVWHTFPDGGACFAQPDGGWVYTSNSEISGGRGGAGALRFGTDGTLTAAYRILSGTSSNCAGGKTPWGTWLSCEETGTGRVWECDPTGATAATVRPALGVFQHEAVAVDPARGRLYLSEDQPDGRLYRFTPAAYPDLSAGTLEVLALDGDRGAVTWLPVPDPSAASTPTRRQVDDSKAFEGGEGLWYDAGLLYYTTKGDGRVWVLETARDVLDVLYDPERFEDPPLTGVDNVTVHRSGDVFVAEDGGTMDIVMITPDRVVAQFLTVVGQTGSEITGPAFDPSGSRLYFSSQRGGVPATASGNGLGITYEVTGPFRSLAPEPSPSPSPTIRPIGPAPAPRSVLPATERLPFGPAAGLGVIAAALALRRRRCGTSDLSD